MPRAARVAPGGFVYHVLNRGVARMKLFRRAEDFLAFERIMLQAHRRFPLRILAYCLMPNHWHFVVYPRRDGEMTEFFRWLTLTHAMRWRVSHGTVGYGPLYQGRFKSFPVQRDESVLDVCRYVERNAKSAQMVERAQDWRFGSLWTRENGAEEMRSLLSDWPVDRPANWTSIVNAAVSDRELARFRTSIQRARPFGSETWVQQTVRRLGLGHTIRDEGRPKKSNN